MQELLPLVPEAHKTAPQKLSAVAASLTCGDFPAWQPLMSWYMDSGTRLGEKEFYNADRFCKVS